MAVILSDFFVLETELLYDDDCFADRTNDFNGRHVEVKQADKDGAPAMKASIVETYKRYEIVAKLKYTYFCCCSE